LPAVLIGLYTRWLNGRALVVGWLCGIGAGTWMAAQSGFKAAVYVLHFGGLALPCYAALSSLALNIVVSVALSFVFNAMLAPLADTTLGEDYA
jgi:SSS family solute:Na+ symporter